MKFIYSIIYDYVHHASGGSVIVNFRILSGFPFFFSYGGARSVNMNSEEVRLNSVIYYGEYARKRKNALQFV